jgi:SAM-dependent methyltransferase
MQNSFFVFLFSFSQILTFRLLPLYSSLKKSHFTVALSQLQSNQMDCPVNHTLVGNWVYWFREKGMQTSTDDFFVSFVALVNNIDLIKNNFHVSNIFDETNYWYYNYNVSSKLKYMDLGCGIGSVLFLISYNLKPQLSIGIEVQSESLALTKKSIIGLPNDSPPIDAYCMDLRSFNQENTKFRREFDLITANPPYCRANSGTYCKDFNKKNAHFELHGGIEEYSLAASKLLSKNGRFVFSFWSGDDNDRRVQNTLNNCKLKINRKVHILAG